ncbi:MAG: hypothetical protein UU93_C0015G0003 [Candidatus Amesbacteria bacterium GW2011_GWA2_42_12]|uniref:Uncharacterized protein n=1 Tax=Candidatus Amesbacteria bacterium GW2011_GWA2_42_12 TaxID=1618356 RepID=A0A0G0Y4H8_9BACT|nr:MAG: hypothetical protein UU93_C0015G0003 [Candidatus Amesbacteria bacterium GW2011_GWA2_42_12]
MDKRCGRLFLLIAGSSKGRTGDFESPNLGSIPSPAALMKNFKFGPNFAVFVLFFGIALA